MASEGYHEDGLSEQTKDMHRAIVSLMEELEAVDWYEQRIANASDPELAAILRHNADEEKEHAAMVLEWLRRRDDELDRQLRTYLFTSAPIADPRGSSDAPSGDPGVVGLGIGKIGPST
jgi:ferritin-like protein